MKRAKRSMSFNPSGPSSSSGSVVVLQTVVKSVGYAHLVDVSVAGKGKQAGLLVLPTEASATHCAVGFRHRNLDELTGNGAAALSGLRVGKGNQRVAVNGLNKTVAQNVERCAQCPHILRARHRLLGLAANRAVIHQGTRRNCLAGVANRNVGVHEIAGAIEMADAQLSHLAAAADVGRHVAINATTSVKGRTDPLWDIFFVRESHRVCDKGGG